MSRQLVPPSPPATWPYAHLYAFRRDPLGFMTMLARDCGDIAYYEVGPNQFFYVNHPDLIKDVLVTQDRHFVKYFNVERTRQFLGNGLFVSEGEFHTRQRRIAQPFFHHQRIINYAAKIVASTEELRHRWTHGQTLDLTEDMNWVTMVIAVQTLFGADFSEETEAVREVMSEILSDFDQTILPPGEEHFFFGSRQKTGRSDLSHDRATPRHA